MEATAATLERRVRVIPATRKPEELHRDHDGKMRVAAYTEFDNELVRQVIQKITVEDAETIHIHFRDSDVVLEQEVE